MLHNMHSVGVFVCSVDLGKGLELGNIGRAFLMVNHLKIVLSFFFNFKLKCKKARCLLFAVRTILFK